MTFTCMNIWVNTCLIPFSFRILPTSELRWSKKYGRALSGTEMLAIMGLPMTRALADAVSLTPPAVGKIGSAAQAASTVLVFPLIAFLVRKMPDSGQGSLAGNGMDIQCIGFVLMAACPSCLRTKATLSTRQALICLDPIEKAGAFLLSYCVFLGRRKQWDLRR